jgi:hypothetical protein
MSNIQRARRIPNANGQVLIENWVEERATEHIDHRLEQQNNDQSSSRVVSPQTTKKTSHTALLTQNFQAPLDNVTTYRDNYYKFGPFDHVQQGARRKRLEHALTREVAAELNARKREYEENLRKEHINDSTSEYRTQYFKEFESKPPPTTQVIKKKYCSLFDNKKRICSNNIILHLFCLRKHFNFVYLTI